MKNRFLALVYSKSNAVTVSSVNDQNYNSFWQNFFLFSGFTMLLFGIKLWLIGSYGNAIPFWDQWDAEADRLYYPFIKGNLRPLDLLKPHNEHYIFTTQLLNLGVFSINKIWNPLLQMVVNAALHVILLAVCLKYLVRVIGKNYLPVLLFFMLILFSIPFGWENLLTGFQSEFYLVSLFSIVALWLLTTRTPLSIGWWGGTVCATLSFLSLASGVLVFAAATFVGLFFCLTDIRKTRQWVATCILAVLFVFSYWLTPKLGSQHVEFSKFFNALLTIHSWPFSSGYISAVIRNLPAIVFSIAMIWQRPPAKDYRWFLFAMLVLSFAQAVSIAYGRAEFCLSPRYIDLFAINILLNFACLILMAEKLITAKRIFTTTTVFVWTLVLLIALGVYAGNNLPINLINKQSTSLIQETNTKNYLLTNNFDYLKDKPFLEIPYPSAERLASLLAVPEILNILPKNISLPIKAASVSSSPNQAFAPNGYWHSTPKLADSVWGSFGTLGNSAMGQLSIHFATGAQSGNIEIPVAGYPGENGMGIKIEQHGRLKPVVIKNNPAENWQTYKASVDNAPFTIHVIDSNETKWLAVGFPYMVGRLDKETDSLLDHYYIVIMTGLCFLIFGMIQTALTIKKQVTNNL